MSQKIWVTSDAVVDLIPDSENHYLRCAGGAPANVAVGVARLGSQSAFIGRVGNDPLGQFMQDTLNAENVNTQHMILDPQHRTSTVVVGLDNGERSFTFMV
ncbi:MAG: PfkB family carbohydrate kinase, partial [Haemophilus parainfluenzae]|nr:PfkB family carbohydrate kinase [Haemophilus parainfluenzae]